MPLSKAKKPESLTIYTYQVGFGDCFLLVFNYPDGDKRNMLIDFGSTQKPAGYSNRLKDLMLKIAENIKDKCKIPGEKRSKLHVVVASHRHRDHIGGFSTKKSKKDEGKTTSGDIIKSLKPDLVIQPWTESPELNDEDVIKDFQNKKHSNSEKNFSDPDYIKENSQRFHISTLHNMHKVAEVVYAEANRLGEKEEDKNSPQSIFVHTISNRTRDQLIFMAKNNMSDHGMSDVSNKSAVINLRKMGERKVNGGQAGYYVKFGDKVPLGKVIPGVEVKVLGPPDLEQHNSIKRQRKNDKEYWMLQSMLEGFWGMQAATANLAKTFADSAEDADTRLFRNSKIYQGYAPSHTRWFIRQIREARAGQLLELVRILDRALNNTSLILLFQANKKKLLFSGDAQIENWEYALSKKDIIKELSKTDVYKVGHHGSRNATPKTLWKSFRKKSKDENNSERLRTFMSTLHGKHGDTEATAVPRKTLVKELDTYSELLSSVDIEQLYKKTEIKLT